MAAYDAPVRPRPQRLERLPEQYFGALLARVAAAGDVVDRGRGNPEPGPPAHRVGALAPLWCPARDLAARPWRGLAAPLLARAARRGRRRLPELPLEPVRRCRPGRHVRGCD